MGGFRYKSLLSPTKIAEAQVPGMARRVLFEGTNPNI